jgi:phosphate transport system permease protein
MSPDGSGEPALDLTRHPARRRGERFVTLVLACCAGTTALVTTAVVFVLVRESVEFLRVVSVFDFLAGTRWEPLFDPPSFGVLPLVAGTLMVTLGAALVAVPTGLLTAIFLSEYASARTQAILKPMLEILAGIPTVVYGYFALTFVTPLLRAVVPGTDVFNAASASIVVGIMIVPTVASLSEDAIRAVPDSLRAAAFGLGATRLEVATRVVVPAALSGIMASFMLAMARAIGETMAVTIAAGALPQLTLDPFSSIQTMTSYLVQVSLGDTPRGTIVYRTLFAVGMLLFLITLIINVVSQRVLERYREVYR